MIFNIKTWRKENTQFEYHNFFIQNISNIDWTLNVEMLMLISLIPDKNCDHYYLDFYNKKFILVFFLTPTHDTEN